MGIAAKVCIYYTGAPSLVRSAWGMKKITDVAYAVMELLVIEGGNLYVQMKKSHRLHYAGHQGMFKI